MQNRFDAHLVHTFLVFVIGYGLNFASMTVTGSFEDIECIVVDEMSIFVHISDGPITQLTIVDDAVRRLRTVSANNFPNKNLKYCRTIRWTHINLPE